ncbi:hypothetical protein KC216_21550, partial [Mycobacterium tuberculosis]|uniref:hypothetical protein n=1 Tax=Mycobacterium tuberculosis TaxID=1773 RepID=UPI001B846431
MLTTEQWLAAGIALVCAVLLLRLVAGAHRRERMDRNASRMWSGLKGAYYRVRTRAKIKRAAEQAAREAIERARHGVERRGNVYTP